MDIGKHNDQINRMWWKKQYLEVSFYLFIVEDDDDEDNVIIPGVGPIAMHASNNDDPLLEIKDDVIDVCFEWFVII